MNKTHEHFIGELKSLLRKYNAELIVNYYYTEYGEISKDISVSVNFCDSEIEDLNLSDCIDGLEDE